MVAGVVCCHNVRLHFDHTPGLRAQVAAGGKLYQVVVDTEATAKALLSHGQLRNRVTIIPLNKVGENDSRAIEPCPIDQVATPGTSSHWSIAHEL